METTKQQQQLKLSIIIIIMIYFYYLLYFRFFIIFHRVFNRDTGWGKEMIRSILCVYTFAVSFGCYFSNYNDSTFLKW